MSKLLHKRIVMAEGRGRDQLMVSCLALSRMDTKYADGSVDRVAAEIQLSPRQVYRRIKAGSTWRALRRFCPQGQFPRLPFTFFAEMGDLWSKYEFSPLEAIEALRTAEKEKSTVEQMVKYVTAEAEGTLGRLRGIVQSASKLLDAGIVNKDWRSVEKARRILGA